MDSRKRWAIGYLLPKRAINFRNLTKNKGTACDGDTARPACSSLKLQIFPNAWMRDRVGKIGAAKTIKDGSELAKQGIHITSGQTTGTLAWQSGAVGDVNHCPLWFILVNEESYHIICCTRRNSLRRKKWREKRGKLLLQSRLRTLIGFAANRKLKIVEAFLNRLLIHSISSLLYKWLNRRGGYPTCLAKVSVNIIWI